MLCHIPPPRGQECFGSEGISRSQAEPASKMYLTNVTFWNKLMLLIPNEAVDGTCVKLSSFFWCSPCNCSKKYRLFCFLRIPSSYFFFYFLFSLNAKFIRGVKHMGKPQEGGPDLLSILAPLQVLQHSEAPLPWQSFVCRASKMSHQPL